MWRCKGVELLCEDTRDGRRRVVGPQEVSHEFNEWRTFTPNHTRLRTLGSFKNEPGLSRG